MLNLAKYLKLPTRSGETWFVDFNKPPNYETLTGKQQESLNKQIEQMIKNRRVKESDGRALNASGGLQAMLGE